MGFNNFNALFADRLLETGLLVRELALAAFRDLTHRVSTIVTVSFCDIDTLAPRVSEEAAQLRARPLPPTDRNKTTHCGLECFRWPAFLYH